MPLPSNTLRQAAWVDTGNAQTTGDWRFPLGTDSVGHDVLSQVIWGARTSMVVGFIPMVLIVTVGTAVGFAAGYSGGRMDNLLMRFTDVVYAFPDILFFIIVMSALRETAIGGLLNGLFLLFVALSFVNWVGVARLVRGQVLSLKEKEFVEAARMLGASDARIVFRHILPNSLAHHRGGRLFGAPGHPDRGLSGVHRSRHPAGQRPLGRLPDQLGHAAARGKDAIRGQPWLLFSPAICIALVMLAFTFVGDGLRDALDPMMKGTS